MISSNISKQNITKFKLFFYSTIGLIALFSVFSFIWKSGSGIASNDKKNDESYNVILQDAPDAKFTLDGDVELNNPITLLPEQLNQLSKSYNKPMRHFSDKDKTVEKVLLNLDGDHKFYEVVLQCGESEKVTALGKKVTKEFANSNSLDIPLGIYNVELTLPASNDYCDNKKIDVNIFKESK